MAKTIWAFLTAASRSRRRTFWRLSGSPLCVGNTRSASAAYLVIVRHSEVFEGRVMRAEGRFRTAPTAEHGEMLGRAFGEVVAGPLRDQTLET